jgi:hypothetical protein
VTASRKEEDELRPVEVTDLRQLLEQLGQQPHQEGREEDGPVLHPRQLDGADHAAAVRGGPQHVGRLPLRLAEEDVAAELLEPDELAQDHAGGRRGQAAQGLQLGSALVADQPGEHRTQILDVEERQPGLVGVVEHQPEGALLGRVEPQHLGEQHRAERGHRRAHGHAGAEPAEREVLHGVTGRLPGIRGGRGALGDPVAPGAGVRQAAQVALHVGEDDGDAGRRQLLGHELQRLRLARPGRAGHQAVPVHHRQRQPDRRAGVRRSAGDHDPEVESRAVDRVARRDPGRGLLVGGRLLLGGFGGRGGLRHSRRG